MGGEGSGRKPSVETIIKQSSPDQNPVGTGLFLPNYSGVQKAALKTETPLSAVGDNLGNHIATQTISGSKIVLENTGTTPSIKITGTGVGSNSTSVGGLLNITTTGQSGSALILFSNQGADANGRMLNIRTDNAAFPQDALHIDHTGTADAFSITSHGSNAISLSHDGTDHTIRATYTGSGSNIGCASFTSTGDFTTMQVIGQELAQGTIKVTHNGTGSDANAAALSIDLTGVGTAAQGIFIDSTQGGTSGKLLNLRVSGSEVLTLEATGGTRITPTADYGTDYVTSGAFRLSGSFVLDNTANQGTGLVVYSGNTSPSNASNLALFYASKDSWNRPIVRIMDETTAGGGADIRIDSPNPDIELVESDQSTPNGKFEIAVQGNRLQLNSRNGADNSYEVMTRWQQRANGGLMEHNSSMWVSGSVMAGGTLSGSALQIKGGTRWLRPYHFQPNTATQAFIAGRVYLSEFEVLNNCVVDAINYTSGTSVSGSVFVGIYGTISTEETCSGAALLVSGSALQSGTSTAQLIAIPATALTKGRYYVALEGQDISGSYMRDANFNPVDGWGQQYDRAGGYGALTNPCPATTNTGSAIPTIAIRCSS